MKVRDLYGNLVEDNDEFEKEVRLSEIIPFKKGCIVMHLGTEGDGCFRCSHREAKMMVDMSYVNEYEDKCETWTVLVDIGDDGDVRGLKEFYNPNGRDFDAEDETSTQDMIQDLEEEDYWY